MASGVPLDNSRRIAVAAFAAAGAGVVGLAGVQLCLRPGLPFDGVDLAQRAQYLERHGRCWSWGWMLAGIGALLVVNLYRVLAARWEGTCAGKCRMAMILATAGMGADFAGIALWMLVAPGLDAAGLSLVEKMAAALSLFAAKILYASAGVLLTLAGRREFPRPLFILSFGVWLAGLAVAIATARAAGSAQIWSLAALVVLFIAWSSLLGFHFLGLEAGRAGVAVFHPDPRD